MVLADHVLTKTTTTAARRETNKSYFRYCNRSRNRAPREREAEHSTDGFQWITAKSKKIESNVFFDKTTDKSFINLSFLKFRVFRLAHKKVKYNAFAQHSVLFTCNQGFSVSLNKRIFLRNIAK